MGNIYIYIYIYIILSRIRSVTRRISSLCQECSDYLLRFASAITLYNYTTSTIFNGDHPKTVLRIQSPLIYAVVAKQ
jgi:hypothetical protein